MPIDSVSYAGLDMFFETTATAFYVMKTKGRVSYDVTTAVFAYDSVELYFRWGIDFLNEALLPEILNALLDWKSAVMMKKSTLSDEELLQITLLRYIFDCYNRGDYSSFLDLCGRLCTHQCYNKCAALMAD